MLRSLVLRFSYVVVLLIWEKVAILDLVKVLKNFLEAAFDLRQ